jgi:chromosome segregation ATPase
MKNNTTIKIPVSAGELLDKITILEIKVKFIKDPVRLFIVSSELNNLNRELGKILLKLPKTVSKLNTMKSELYKINLRLWRIEDKIRKFEAEKDFGKGFITSARNIYRLNDKRSAIKDKINRLMGSDIQEVKQYTKY